MSAGRGWALEVVQVTAERVRRFADLVEGDPMDDESRRLWRAALDDFRRSVRVARAEGSDAAAIQEAAGQPPPGRFTPRRATRRASAASREP